MNALGVLRRRQVTTYDLPLVDVAAALEQALEAGADHLEPALVERAWSVLAKVDARTAIAGGHTVVALAGATGSGKSSLFNALVGGPVSTIGARRPTSSTATAAVWGDEPSTGLLDWLNVGTRHHVEVPPAGLAAGPAASAEASAAALDGLVLLDLPDFDSRVLGHRAEADRVLDLADVFVWVTDPQKYADARLHDDYVSRLAGHQATTLVVLNQADRLDAESVEVCRRDLSELLAADGIRGADVVATSARDGSGVADLSRQLSEVVRERTAAERRLVGDIRAAARDLLAGVADSEPDVAVTPDGALVDALLGAAGAPIVLDAVERDYRRESLARTGWPFTRWARRLRPDPLRRLGLGDGDGHDDGGAGSGRGGGRGGTHDDDALHLDRQDVLRVLGRSSLPAPTPSARASVGLASTELGDQAAAGLPRRWADACMDAASPPGSDLADALDQAVVSTPLRGRQPVWWTLLGRLQWLLALAVVVGLLWLVALGVIGWLRLPEVPTPDLGPIPYPTVGLVGGILLGLVLAWLGRILGRLGARRRRAAVEAALRDAVTAVAQESVVAPVQAVLAAHAWTRQHLAAAAGP